MEYAGKNVVRVNSIIATKIVQGNVKRKKTITNYNFSSYAFYDQIISLYAEI